MKKKYALIQLLLIFSITINHFSIAQNPDSTRYHKVNARKNADDKIWKTYQAKTVDSLTGFKITQDPELSVYGGWKVNQSKATGFFRVEKKGERWWIIDPEGYPFIAKGVAVFGPGGSEAQKEALKNKYETPENWAKQETKFLKSYGFNAAGAWSRVDLFKGMNEPLVYTVIVAPMDRYKSKHKKKFGGKYLKTGWQGFRFDLAMVFDPEFDEFVESEIKQISNYANDKYLLGYFTDNELPWVNDALDRHLTLLAKDEAGYLAAKKWLDERKGKDATIDDITSEDRLAFTGFYFEAYIKKVAEAVRKYDPNHLFLGCRFNQSGEELKNPEIFKVAGKYMDVISINHYRKWEPDQTIMSNWANWSGKPFIITEWYTKGEDSGLPNRTGAGWNVPTQLDRGYFYQNFTIELLKSKSCVGWHWFTYQDNDPSNMNTDPSNRDSNKGVVNSKFEPYLPLLENMKMLNSHVFGLTQYFDK
jgi:hypothetical protein